MRAANITWWLSFIIIGLIIQMYVPGIDILVVGFIILLQDRDLVQLLWVAPYLILLQEGMGSLDFGGAILWYACIAFVYFIGYFLFENSTFLFMIVIGMGVGLSNVAFTWIIAALQFHEVDTELLLHESLIQFFIVPILWKLATITRSRICYETAKR